jgi:hypothetical protein
MSAAIRVVLLQLSNCMCATLQLMHNYAVFMLVHTQYLHGACHDSSKSSYVMLRLLLVLLRLESQ